MGPDVGVNVRVMEPGDVDQGLRLSRAAGWNQTREDWEMFLRLSPSGCLVAVADDRVIGTVATVSYGDRFAWIAMVLVDPIIRRRGIGTRLMTEALDVLTHVPCIRLDATPAGREVYRQLGFVDEYPVTRMELPEPTVRAGLTIDAGAATTPSEVRPGGRPALMSAVRPMARDDMPAASSLDLPVFGADRALLLAWQFARAPEFAWAHETRGAIDGYLLGRHGSHADHLGPLIAPDRRSAVGLLDACLHQRTTRPVILDATRHDTDWYGHLYSLGFREQRSFTRMYRGAAPAGDAPDRQYAVFGPEFG
ncbi:MAG: GNAT family N-acetyltransferase [Gemmatimonadaceae bacterium]